MICQKCLKDFPEKEIDESHDFPKYMGGEDKHGRHQLCKECHEEYEREVMKVGLMWFIKSLPELDKVRFRNAAKLVSKYFFKKNDTTNTPNR